MPRKATNDLSTKSIDELLKLRSQVDQQLAQRRASLERELSRIRGVTTAGATTRRRPSTVGSKVPPKYRGPKGETWAGRGLRPTWLAALLKQGHKHEEYAVGKQAASRKRIATKKSGR